MEWIQILGSSVGLALLSGINLYATTLTLGLALRFNLLTLPERLAGLEVLGNEWIIGISAIMFIVEFFADKIPWVDTAWDSIQTFIRPLGAGLIGIAAMGDLEPALQIVLFLVFGGVGLTSHATKAGTRVLVNHSPEPFSNIILSTLEDILVIVATWVFIQNPLIGVIAVAIFLILFVLIAPKLFRLLAVLLSGVMGLIRGIFGWKLSTDALPPHLANYIDRKSGTTPPLKIIRCRIGRGIPIPRHAAGYLLAFNDSIVVVCKTLFRTRHWQVPLADITDISMGGRVLYGVLEITAAKRRYQLLVNRDRWEAAGQMVEIIMAKMTRADTRV